MIDQETISQKLHPFALLRIGRMRLGFRLNHIAGDLLAIGLSGLCLVHCFITMLVLGTLGSLSLGAVAEQLLVGWFGTWWLHPMLHIIGLALAIGLGCVSILIGILRHRALYPMLLVGGGLGAMSAALLVPHGAGEFALMLVGGGIVAHGHWRNMHTPCLR